jgi:hypothetical protein
MNNNQLQSLKILHEQYKKNCSQNALYGSSEYCEFNVYEHIDNDIDKNITVVINEIYDYTEDMIPKTRLSNKMILENGEVINLEAVINKSEIVSYLNNLTKIKLEL